MYLKGEFKMVKRRGLKGGRFSACRKQETVLRLLRGEDPDAVALSVAALSSVRIGLPG